MKTIRKRTAKAVKSTEKLEKDVLQVFCRLRPTNHQICMQITSPTILSVNLPTYSTYYNKNNEKQFIFNQIFPSHTTQQQVFDTVVKPLIEGLIQGQNGLLFTYGTSGSGKSYTITGTKKAMGLIPRCFQVLFRTIQHNQADKFIFKSDRFNGFDIQTKTSAHFERTRENRERRKFEHPTSSSSADSLPTLSDDEITSISGLEEGNMYAVFITYVEIYNNNAYDLLDVTDQRMPTRKIIREDTRHNMFVHNVTEMEVRSPSEAMAIFYKGQKFRKTTHSELNTGRSHAVFTVRLVQAPVDLNEHEKDKIIISQLSLVDLAASGKPTQNATTGQTKEISNVNSSLLNLRLCLSILLNNFKNSENNLIPYRDSKLTYLFKSFFENGGLIRMIVCLNPSIFDFEGSIYVLKFTQLFQEASVVKSEIVEELKIPSIPENRKIDYPKCEIVESIRQKFESAAQKPIQNTSNESTSSTDSEIDIRNVFAEIITLNDLLPRLEINEFTDVDKLTQIGEWLENRIKKRQKILTTLKKIISEFNNECQKADYYRNISATELNILRESIIKFETKCEKLKKENDELRDVLEKKQQQIFQAKVVLNEQMFKISEQKLELETYQKLFDENQEADQEIHHPEDEDETSSNVNEPNQVEVSMKRTLSETELHPAPVETQESSKESPLKESIKTASRRPRSISVDSSQVWLEHRVGNVTKNRHVLFQPTVKRVKFSEVDPEDMSKIASRYCLITEQPDTDGDLEMRAIKGEIVPTQGGGSQVVFGDMEVLKVTSPSAQHKSETFDFNSK